ncbi:MAG: M43 family zinc metalloprotease [bacterium]|nr:M43 family zinc metalloprotease [bacterium]
MRLRKTAYILSVIFCCFLCLFCCKADTNYAGAVEVVEGSSIDIYARIAVFGEIADDFIGTDNITYENAFFQGVTEMWSGEYQGKPVKVHLQHVSPEYNGAKIKVIFNKTEKPEDISYADKQSGTIWMYTADGRDGVFYTGTEFVYRGARNSTKEEFMYTSGHEFGHILGLADCYNDDNERVRSTLETPMRSRQYHNAREVDYYILLNHQTWLADNLYRYSNDKLVFKYIPCEKKNLSKD